MTQNLHVSTICFRPVVVYDVISGRNVKTIGGNFVVNFEFAGFSCFRDNIKRNHFVTAEAGIDDSIKQKRLCVSLNNYGFKTDIAKTLSCFGLKSRLKSA